MVWSSGTAAGAFFLIDSIPLSAAALVLVELARRDHPPLQLAHLMRLKAHSAGHDLSVRAILDSLAGIGETVLIYRSTAGRAKARRMTTDTTDQQHVLFDLYDPVDTRHPLGLRPQTPTAQSKSRPRSTCPGNSR